MKYKDFFLRLIGQMKPTIFQMLCRRINIIYDSLWGLDFLSVISLKELGLDETLVVQGSPSGNRYLSKLLKMINTVEKMSLPEYL